MGNFATGQNWLLLCNLLTNRRKKRRKHAAFDKRIINLCKEQQYLLDIILNMDFEELEVPIQQGYKRLFELSEVTKREKDAGFFESILKKINVIQYSKDKQFQKLKSKRIGKYKYKKRGNPVLLDLTEREFNALNEKEKLYFYRMEIYHPNTKLWTVKYRFAEPWRFELRIRPNMLTKVRRRNWEAEYRISEIEKFLVAKKNFTKTEKSRKAYGWKLKDEWDFRRWPEDPLRNKPLHEVMEEYNEEKQ